MWLLALGTACVGESTDPTSPLTPPDTTPRPFTVWPDHDDDGFGFGTDEDGREVTADEPGWVRNSFDCDDTDPSVNPSGTDRCEHNDAIDGDCDGWEHPEDGSEVCT